MKKIFSLLFIFQAIFTFSENFHQNVSDLIEEKSMNSSKIEIIFPFQAAADSEIYLAWKVPEKIESKNLDYFIYLDGKELSETAGEQSFKTNPYAANFKKSFYEFYDKKKTEIEMIKTNENFYKIENLESEKTYKIRVSAKNLDDKSEILSSDEIEITTKKAPAAILNILDFGASEKNENNAQFIQKAIDSCPENGIVYVPEGTFISSSINLKSDMTLKIDGELKGSPNANDYDFGFLMYEYYTDKRYFGLINANGAKNLRLTGKGTVNGNGWKYRSAKGKLSENPQFYKESGDAENFYLPKFVHSSSASVRRDGILAASCVKSSKLKDEKKSYATRSTTVILKNVENLLIDGLTFTNPANHMINIIDSKNVSITGIKEFAYDANNGDGIGIICTQNGFIWNNFIDTGDDSIVFSSGVGKSAATTGEKGSCDFMIFGNYIHHGHGGIAFGSHTALGIWNVLIEGNIFSHTDAPFRIKSAPANGGEVYNVFFRNNAMAENKQPFTMSTSYSDNGTVSKYGAAEKQAVFHDIFIENATSYGSSQSAIFISANDGNFHYNINFKNVTFANIGMKGGSEKLEDWFFLKNLKNCAFENVNAVSWNGKTDKEKPTNLSLNYPQPEE